MDAETHDWRLYALESHCVDCELKLRDHIATLEAEVARLEAWVQEVLADRREILQSGADEIARLVSQVDNRVLTLEDEVVQKSERIEWLEAALADGEDDHERAEAAEQRAEQFRGDVIREWWREVCALAEEKMMATGQLEGAHYAAATQLLAALEETQAAGTTTMYVYNASRACPAHT